MLGQSILVIVGLVRQELCLGAWAGWLYVADAAVNSAVPPLMDISEPEML